MQRSQGDTSSFHRMASVQSDLAIAMYGYGLASQRVAATEGMTPRTAEEWITSAHMTPRSRSATPRKGRFHSHLANSTSSSTSTTPRSSITPRTPRTARSSSSSNLAGNHWNLRPKQQLDLRGAMSVSSQRMMEIADLSFLQAADLVASDDRSSHDGLVNVHESADLDSPLVRELSAHTRLHVVDLTWLDDGTKRVLVVLEGDSAPLGWATAITPDGIPLIYLFARPLYEVGKQPLKARLEFDQSSKFRKQLPPGTRLHVVETRRTNNGAQRVCVVVLGEDDPIGWVTSFKPDGRRTLKEVKGLDGSAGPTGSSPRSPGRSPGRSGRRGSIMSRDPESKYYSMSSDALEQAVLEFISQRDTFTISKVYEHAITEVEQQAVDVVSKLQVMTTTFFDGGEKPLSVQLGEILQKTPFSLEEMMAEAEGSGSNPAITGKITKMEFRMYLRKLLDKKTMLSSMTGAAEIDTIFPMLDTNGDGEIDISELELALVLLEEQRAAYQEKVDVYRMRDNRYKQQVSRLQTVLELTKRSEAAFKEREVEKGKSVGPQIGSCIQSKGWTAPQVAKVWAGETNNIDKAGFRKQCVGIGVDFAAPAIDGLFDSLSSSGTMDQVQLEAALEQQIEAADALKPTFRKLNIKIVDATKPMKAAQNKFKVQAEEWAEFMRSEQERAARERAEEETIQRASKKDRVKHQTSIAGALSPAPAAARKPKAKKK